MATSGLSNDNCPLPWASPSLIGTVINDNPPKPWYNYYISRKISIDYPSVGLASLAELAPVLAKTPEIQCSSCYSAVSALLTNPLPDHSNYSPFLPHPLPHSGWINTSLVSSGQTLYQAAQLETHTLLLQRFTAESSRELKRNMT